MLILALALASATATPPRELQLSSQDRYLLLSGIREKLGGRFIVSGLADADASCKLSGSCVTAHAAAEALRGTPDAETVRSVDGLVANTRVNGQPVETIVSFRSARLLRRDSGPYMQLVASVYDARSQRWTDKVAVLEAVTSPGVPKLENWRRLRSFDDVASGVTPASLTR